MIAFDLTRRETFQNCRNWVRLFEEHGTGDLEKTSIVVVGNKSDLKERREVTKEEAEQLCQQINATYFETSVFDDSGVEEPFMFLAHQVLAKCRKGVIPLKNQTSGVEFEDSALYLLEKELNPSQQLTFGQWKNKKYGNLSRRVSRFELEQKRKKSFFNRMC